MKQRYNTCLFKFMIAQNGLLLDFYEGEPTSVNAVTDSGKCRNPVNVGNASKYGQIRKMRVNAVKNENPSYIYTEQNDECLRLPKCTSRKPNPETRPTFHYVRTYVIHTWSTSSFLRSRLTSFIVKVFIVNGRSLTICSVH